MEKSKKVMLLTRRKRMEKRKKRTERKKVEGRMRGMKQRRTNSNSTNK